MKPRCSWPRTLAERLRICIEVVLDGALVDRDSIPLAHTIAS
jgi:hypothetical protein